MNVWIFSANLTRRLLIWSISSVLITVPMFFSASPFLRGLAIQFLAWGVVDGAIAIFGARMSANKQKNLQQDETGEVETKEAHWLSRILWVNTGLDMVYVLGGIWLFQTWGTDSSLWRGHGVGIVIQGGFLFLFDLYHAFALRNLRLT